MEIRRGVIVDATFERPDAAGQEDALDEGLGRSLVNLRLWEIDDWTDALGLRASPRREASQHIADWFNSLFGAARGRHNPPTDSASAREEPGSGGNPE